MDPIECEREHVQRVYEEIGDHFSITRYKPWPVVDRFMRESVEAGWLGVDVGCGNGKNMQIRAECPMVGVDLSLSLLSICQERGLDTLCASMINIPCRRAVFDFALCIASLHHLATAERRQSAVGEILRTLKAGAPILIFVWAWERDKNGSVYRHYERLKWLNEQDVLVPWMKPDGSVTDRFYHLFKEHELDAMLLREGVEILESGYDRDNWYVIARK